MAHPVKLSAERKSISPFPSTRCSQWAPEGRHRATTGHSISVHEYSPLLWGLGWGEGGQTEDHLCQHHLGYLGKVQLPGLLQVLGNYSLWDWVWTPIISRDFRCPLKWEATCPFYSQGKRGPKSFSVLVPRLEAGWLARRLGRQAVLGSGSCPSPSEPSATPGFAAGWQMQAHRPCAACQLRMVFTFLKGWGEIRRKISRDAGTLCKIQTPVSTKVYGNEAALAYSRTV